MKKGLNKSKTRSLREGIVFYIFMAPFMIAFVLFSVIPIISSMVLSFFDYDMVSTPIFAGLENYLRMFTTDETFSKVLGNTLKFSIVTGPLSFMLAFGLAWMINEFEKTIRVILTFIFYAPALVGNAYYIWQVFFSGDSLGYLNNFLISFGFITEPVNWFQNTSYNMTILIIIQLWMSMGVSFLSNIAGLQNVPRELKEAAKIDGAGYMKIFTTIMLPMTKTAIAAQVIFWFTGIWNDYFAPAIYLKDQTKMTLQPMMAFINSNNSGGTNLPLIMAGAVLSSLPMLIIYSTCQKFFVESMAISGVKG